MKITVTVYTVFPPENKAYTKKDGTPGTFSSRRVWVEDTSNPDYPEFLELTFTGRSIDYATAVDVGDVVEVECALSGRKYTKNGKEGVFMSIRAWNIRKVILGDTEYDNANDGPETFDPYTSGSSLSKIVTPADDLPF